MSFNPSSLDWAWFTLGVVLLEITIAYVGYGLLEKLIQRSPKEQRG